MRRSDINNQDISCFRGKKRSVLAEKLPFTFQDGNGQLSFNFMGMYRQFLAGSEIEVNDFKIWRFMHQVA